MSRCPSITGSFTFLPAENLSLPWEKTAARPVGFRSYLSSFQAASRTIAEITSRSGTTSSKLPMTAMPVEVLLKPSVCAPRTASAEPPARPCQMPPKRSTRKL